MTAAGELYHGQWSRPAAGDDQRRWSIVHTLHAGNVVAGEITLSGTAAAGGVPYLDKVEKLVPRGGGSAGLAGQLGFCIGDDVAFRREAVRQFGDDVSCEMNDQVLSATSRDRSHGFGCAVAHKIGKGSRPRPCMGRR